MLRVYVFILLVLTLLQSGRAQEYPQNYFQPPLEIPLYLSGNFGELRSNHYHSGIDIKTQGREGFDIFAAAEGYVSRVKVSPYGYGNALYINHPNGYTTVYAHLLNFAPKIDSVVKKYQYEQESFAIDEQLPHNLLNVAKGEIIALSGNSGSSSGPHLHYEIRETASEFPTNPLLYGLPIKDDIAPVMRGVFIYPLAENASVDGKNTRKLYPLFENNRHYSIQEQFIPKVSGTIGFGIDVRDYMNATHNYYGIYKLRMYIDGVLKHSFTFNKFSFYESRYINAHIDYSLYKKQKRRIHKLYHEPNQKESFAELSNSGVFFNDNQLHTVTIEVSDINDNLSVLKFKVQAMPFSVVANAQESKYHWDEENKEHCENFFIEIPLGALYRDYTKTKVNISTCERKNSYSEMYKILSDEVPLHKAAKVGVRATEIPLSVKNKAFLARENKGRFQFIGNIWEGEYLTGETKEFGNFVVLLDTIAPSIGLWRGASYKTTGKLRYKITDDLSGIKTFRGEIDGKWVLFEYDAKRDLLWHTLSEQVIVKNQRHTLELTITDTCGNSSKRKVQFWW